MNDENPVYHPEEAEQALLEAAVQNEDAATKICSRLGPLYFTHWRRPFFKAIESLFEKGDKIDEPSVLERLDGATKVAWAQHTRALALSSALSGEVDHWIAIVEDKTRRRAIADLLRRASEQIEDGNFDTPGIIDYVENRLGKISTGKPLFVRTQEQSINALYGWLDTFITNAESTGSVATPWPKLTHWTNGLQPGALWTVAALPGCGKTSAATQLFYRAAMAGHTVLVFSMEMPHTQINRIQVEAASASPWKLRADYQKGNTALFEKAMFEANELRSLPIFWDEREQVGVDQVERTLKFLMLDHKIDLVVIDHLQRCAVKSSREGRWHALGEVVRGLKSIAMRHKVPVLLTSQLNMEAAQVKGKAGLKQWVRPTMANLAQARQGIAAESDVIVFVHPKDEDFREQDQSDVEFIVEKNRETGMAGRINVFHVKKERRFYEQAPEMHYEPA